MSLEVIRRIEEILDYHPREFTTLVAGNNIFAKAVATILSQNTNDKNSIEAYKRLGKIIDITPDNILSTEDTQIIDAIRISGLYQQKLKTIKNLAKKVLEELEGDLSKLAYKDLEEARTWLKSIPGIGDKTADIILLHLGHPTFPVDTHISRITCRLGFTHSRKYWEVSKYWLEALPTEKYLEAHLLLIKFGREICTSRNPKCGKCVLNDICKYYREDGQDCKT